MRTFKTMGPMQSDFFAEKASSYVVYYFPCVLLFCFCVNVFIHVWLKTMHLKHSTLLVDQELGHSLAELSASRSYKIVLELSVRTKVSTETGLRNKTLQNSFGLWLEFIFLLL